MSGLPFVARAADPNSMEGFLQSLSRRLLIQERKYPGPSRGTLSRVGVMFFSDLPADPFPGQEAYVAGTGSSYEADGAGDWVFIGTTDLFTEDFESDF